MNAVIFNVLIIFVLLLCNGIFAMAEIAVVSARKGRLQALADSGSANARAALALVEDPTRFLSTVQIGITLVGIFAGAFGGATLSADFAEVLSRVPVLAPYSQVLAMASVVGAITYFSLVIGELVPKRVALSNPEKRAMVVAVPMTMLSRAAGPVVSLLSHSTNLVLRLVGLGKEVDAPPTDEEVDHLLAQGTRAGVFHRAERRMVEGVLRLDERRVTEVMTRRSKIVWLDVHDPEDVNWRKIVSSGHSHFPVFEDNRDNVLGLVSVKALWANAAAGISSHIRNHIVQPLFVPETLTVIELVESFRRSGKHLALVTDEYGTIRGLVTLIDVMEAIVGDLPEPGDRTQPGAVQREDKSWLVDAELGLTAASELIGLPDLHEEAEGGFETLGGFVLHRLGHIPKAGEKFDAGGWSFEVIDMDRHRIDKLLLHRQTPDEALRPK